MNDWCSSALYKKFLIKKLNEDFAIKVENFSNKNYQSKNKFKNLVVQEIKTMMRASEKMMIIPFLLMMVMTLIKATKRIRISFNKSRRVITEK